jgi:hypothetical protein
MTSDSSLTKRKTIKPLLSSQSTYAKARAYSSLEE